MDEGDIPICSDAITAEWLTRALWYDTAECVLCIILAMRVTKPLQTVVVLIMVVSEAIWSMVNVSCQSNTGRWAMRL
jgi:hypothetical protein